MMLESKIKEYESQLMMMSNEPATQQIMAKFTKTRATSKRGSIISNEEVTE